MCTVSTKPSAPRSPLSGSLRERGVLTRSRRLGLRRAERLAAYPLYAWARVAPRLGLTAPAAITPGLARLFRQRIEYESSVVPALLPRWRDYTEGVEESARWVRSEPG